MTAYMFQLSPSMIGANWLTNECWWWFNEEAVFGAFYGAA